MNELIDFCFQGGTRQQLSGARWVLNCKKTGLLFDRKSTKEAVKYLMNNCFFTLGERIFR